MSTTHIEPTEWQAPESLSDEGKQAWNDMHTATREVAAAADALLIENTNRLRKLSDALDLVSPQSVLRAINEADRRFLDVLYTYADKRKHAKTCIWWCAGYLRTDMDIDSPEYERAQKVLDKFGEYILRPGPIFY